MIINEEKPVNGKIKTKTRLSKKSACVISAKDIVVKLHTNANSKVEEKYSDYFVQNTAIDGEGDNLKFYGAGQHLIAAIPKSKDDGSEATIKKTDALEVLKLYISWFSGPDIAKKLKIEMLKPLEEAQKPAEKEHKNLKPKEPEEPKESISTIPSFNQYLLNEATPPPPPSGDEESAPGYCISYKIEFEGQKTHPIKDAIKKLIGDLFSTLGIQFGNWMSGNNGDVHTLGGLKKGFQNIFGGKFTADKLVPRVVEEYKKRFPDSDPNVKVIDGQTIISYIGKQLEAVDASKIKKAQYSLCTRISKNDKSYKLYNRRVIAEVLTSAIDGFFKKIKIKKLGLPRFTKNDVVFVNNYSDYKRDKGEVKYDTSKINRAEGAVADSLKVEYSNQLITEAVDINSRVEKMRDALRKNAKDVLKDKVVSTDVDTSSDVISRIKVEAAVDPRTLFMLQKYKYLYVIKTEIEKEAGSSDDDLLKDVQKVFTNVVFDVATELGDGSTPSEKAIRDLKPMSCTLTTESRKNDAKVNQLMNLLFEEIIVEAMSEDDVIKSLDKQIRSSLTDTIKSQINTKLQVNPKAGFGKVDDVAQELEQIGLLNDTAKQKLKDAKYAFYFAIKKTKEVKDADGNEETIGGSIGNQLFKRDNIVKTHFSAFDGIKIDSFVSYDQTANKKFAYHKNKEPADSHVFIGTVVDELEPEKPKEKLAQYWVVPDENNFIQPHMKIRVVVFKDPEKADEWEGIGEPKGIDDFEFPKIADMPKNVKGQEAEKFDIESKAALKNIVKDAEDGNGEIRRQHVLLDPDTDEEFVAVRVLYKKKGEGEGGDKDKKEKGDGKINVNRTDYDFYIIPIKGLELKDEEDNTSKK